MAAANFYSLVSVFIVSLISLVGVLALSLKPELLKKLVNFLVSFAAGALLGGVFIHLLPEIALSQGMDIRSSSMILLGIIVFFCLERLVCWRHCHILTDNDHVHTLGIMNLIGDGLHNFTDGMIISAAYLASRPLGIATTLAVIFHEVPQEIGDFSVLVYAGFSRRRALGLNFASALMAVFGAVVVLLIGRQFKGAIDGLVAMTAGGFLYIANADLIPELKKETGLKKTLSQLVGLLIGILVIGLV